MNATAFEELEAAAEELSLWQILELQRKFEEIIEQKRQRASEEGIRLLDSLVGCVPADVSLESAKQEYFEEHQ